MDKPANTDLPIHDLLKKRWSPRAFTEQQITDSELRLILEAARWAPSAMNEQPWRFIIAQRKDNEDFHQLVNCLVSANQVWAKKASVLLAVVARENYRHNEKRNLHAWHDVGQAVAHMTIQATALGLAVHQMAGFDPKAVCTACEIPEGFEPVSMVAIGYCGEPEQLPSDLAERERAARQRLDPTELFFSHHWGKPIFPL